MSAPNSGIGRGLEGEDGGEGVVSWSVREKGKCEHDVRDRSEDSHEDREQQQPLTPCNKK